VLLRHIRSSRFVKSGDFKRWALGSLGPYIIFEAWPIYNMSRDEYFIQKLEENILRYEYFSNKK
jgi:hypothetical protein